MRTPFTMRRSLLAFTFVCGAAGLAAAPAVPTLREPLPFDHTRHRPSLERAGLSCTGCHPVGLRREEADVSAEVPTLPPPPLSTCHGCHAGEIRQVGRGAPTDCLTCHSDLAELRPYDHALDWLVAHGAAARAPGRTCDDCHSASSCLDCHDRRGAGVVDPHPVGFRRFHGVEARLDPRSCSTCHAETSCVACHTAGGRSW